MVALSYLPTFLANHSAFMPVLGLACSGFAVALLHMPGEALRPFGVSENESIMNFSSLGTLRCICGAEHVQDPVEDRRQFCRLCGCEVVQVETAMFDKHLTQKEIKAMTRSLRDAAIRARNMELPPSITSIHELNQYLSKAEPSDSKMPPPSRPSRLEQPQLH